MRLFVIVFFLLLTDSDLSKSQITISNFQLDGPLIEKAGEDRYVGHILLSGTFDDTAHRKIKDKLDLHKSKTIYIHAKSNGGIFHNRDSIIQLMQLIHSYDNIVWMSNGHCYSACAIIGASSKSVQGVLSFHAVTRSSYIKPGFNITNGVIDTSHNEKILNLLVEYGNDKDSIERALSSNRLTPIQFSRQNNNSKQ